MSEKTTKKEKRSKGEKKRLVLLDAHAIIHRAYHALPDFTSSDGEPTGALYGLSAMLLKIVQDLKPDYILAAYDLPVPTDRHKAFTEYKAGRQKAEPDLVQQIERSRDIFKAFGIPVYEKPRFEADDILGTIVENLKKNDNIDLVIASGDMDTLQLVENDRVRVYTLKKGIKDTIIYNEKAVLERFGFPPGLLPDYKGLRGDPSDNIPGVKGIGEKAATELMQHIGAIEKIYETLKNKPGEFAKAGIKERVVKLLAEGEESARFSKMLAEIRCDAPIHFSLPEKNWRDTLDTAKVLALFHDLSFRTLSDRVRQMCGVSSPAGEKVSSDDMSEEEVRKLAIAVWLLDSTQTNPDREDILRFARVKWLADAKEKLEKELAREGLSRVYEEIELPLIPVVERMQTRGVVIDEALLKKQAEILRKELAELEAKIYTHAGVSFNINSPQQLAEVLFDRLGLKGKAKTATGQRSTRESELEKLSGEHPVIDLILEYRELQKLLSTYVEPLPRLLSPEDKRLHARFVQTGTTTGRMSSQNPNLQNIPIRSERAQLIRKAFLATEGFLLIECDYSQIELRVAAGLSGDEKMIKIFKEGGDIHTAVACEVFGVEPQAVDYEKRRAAKVINFGILYGMGSTALAKSLGTSRASAQDFLDAYFKKFSGIARYMEDTRRAARTRGYTETLFGRRRYFPGIDSHLPYVRAEAERMAMNAPIQGTEADIIKLAMIRVDEWIQKEKLAEDAFLLLQVHDELVYELREEKAEGVAREIKKIMEGVLSPKDLGGVPLVGDVSVGKNWGELKRLE